jgi:hypothetical protein
MTGCVIARSEATKQSAIRLDRRDATDYAFGKSALRASGVFTGEVRSEISEYAQYVT